MSGHEKEEWEKELGWIGLGWAGQSCSADGQTEELGSKPGQGVTIPRQLPSRMPKMVKKHPDCATAQSDLTHQSNRINDKLSKLILTLFILLDY